MVITRSVYKKACESFNSSDNSCKSIVPPWCSSGKVINKRKPKKVVAPHWQIRSNYPIRENIWEYLYEDSIEKYSKKRCSKHKQGKHGCGKCFALLVVLIGVMVSAYIWRSHMTLQGDLAKAKLILLPMRSTTSVSSECCQRMKYLAEQLAKAEQAVRNARRVHYLKLTSTTNPTAAVSEAKDIDTRYIAGASATKGGDTKEWGGRLALWGVVPLWRAAPPPDTVLALRRPTLSDCWPFMGSTGELIIKLPQMQRVHYITLEHIHPDTARSAPKHFVIYGLLANDTSIRVAKGQYRSEGPAKQYFPIVYKQVELKSIVFRVMTNHGNRKYTCIYRIHLYGVQNNLAIFENK